MAKIMNSKIRALKILTEFIDEKFNIEQQTTCLSNKIANLEQLSSGKHPVYIMPLTLKGQKIRAAIKVFKQPSKLKHWFDTKYRGGIRAMRVWQASYYCFTNTIPTPKPIALLFNQHTKAHYYISYYHESSTFKDQLSDIFWHKQDNTQLIHLLKYVAINIRKMHDAGLYHGDLGNQNILLNHTNKIWQDLAFIDLDRTKQLKALNLKQRARDFSRIILPSDYLRIFKYMYFHNAEIPPKFSSFVAKYQKRYQRFKKYYYLRHPIKLLKHKRAERSLPLYPNDNDIWIWDNKTEQAMVILEKKDRNRYRSYRHYFKILSQLFISSWSLRQEYKKLLTSSYSSKVKMANRLGLALTPSPNYIEQELSLLKELGCHCVLLRLCHHESRQQWQTTIKLIKTLNNLGFKVSIALLQSRKAITQPDSWRQFINAVIPEIIGSIEWVEVGHAINRVKWGIWHIKEYISLYQPLLELRKHHPNLKLIGPSIIDFEWPRLLNALKSLPKNIKLYATSVHLYVDRRGAPENKQDGFSLIEKCALNKAICNLSNKTEDRFIISEVNWPIQNTGTFSPVNASYIPPKCLHENKGVSETDYANYMIRYIAISLCSGFVDAIYWWKLSAYGYGLVDDQNNWRKRPAFFAMKTFLSLLSNSVFYQRLSSSSNDYILLFEKKDKKIILAWTTKGNKEITSPFVYQKQVGLTGETQVITNNSTMILTESPVYFLM